MTSVGESFEIPSKVLGFHHKVQQKQILDGGFKYFIFTPKIGQDFQFDSYFSDGLVQPPTRDAELGKTLCFEVLKTIISLNKSHLHEIDMVGMISLTHFGCLLISGFFKCS